jgi:hypothetical protein
MINTLERAGKQKQDLKKDRSNGINEKIASLEKALSLSPTDQIKARLEKLYQEQKELSSQEATLEVFQKNFGDIFGATQNPDSQFKLKVFLGYIGVPTNSNDLNKLSQNFFNYLLKIGVAEFSEQNKYANYTVFAEKVAEFPNIQTVFPTLRELVCHRETKDEMRKPHLDDKDYRTTQGKPVITQILYPVSLEESNVKVESEARNNIVKISSQKPGEARTKSQVEVAVNAEAGQSNVIEKPEIRRKRETWETSQTEVEIVTGKSQKETETRTPETIQVESVNKNSAQTEQMNLVDNNNAQSIPARLERLLKSSTIVFPGDKLKELRQKTKAASEQTKTETSSTVDIQQTTFTQNSDFEPNTNQTNPFLIPTPIFQPAYAEVSQSNKSEYSTISDSFRYQTFKSTNLDTADQNQFSTIPNQIFSPVFRTDSEAVDKSKANPFTFQKFGRIEPDSSQFLADLRQVENSQADFQTITDSYFPDFKGINFEPPSQISQTILSSSQKVEVSPFDSIPAGEFTPFTASTNSNFKTNYQPTTETETNPFNQFNYQPTQTFQPQTEIYPQFSESQARLDSLKSSSKTQPEPILSEIQPIEAASKSEPIETKIQDDFVNSPSENPQTKTEAKVEANNITKFAKIETQAANTENDLQSSSESTEINSEPANNIVKFARRESNVQSESEPSQSTSNSTETTDYTSNESQPVAQSTPEMAMA